MALADATAGMSREEMGRHPEGKWCAGEILEHLYLTYTGTTKGFEKVVAAGKPAATPRTMKHRVYTFVSVSLGFFPTGRKSPERAQPRGLPSEQVQAEIGAKISAMDAIITKCEVHFGRGAPILDHPILGALTAAQWRKFHLVHGLHHVKQIRRLRENGGN